jgi:hypothetical protein
MPGRGLVAIDPLGRVAQPAPAPVRLPQARGEPRDLRNALIARDPLTGAHQVLLDPIVPAPRVVTLGLEQVTPRPVVPAPQHVEAWRALERARRRPRSLTLTERPIRVKGTEAQELRLARDVIAFDLLVLELRILTLDGPAGSEIEVALETGMQRESDLGWVALGSFTSVTAAPSAEVKTFEGLLRYVRWTVTVITGDSATFFLCGRGRGWS